ncbi:MAG: hypothetical protein ACR2N4_15980 [Jatrophihabitans sp.]
MQIPDSDPSQFQRPPELQGLLITAEHLTGLNPEQAERFISIIQKSNASLADVEITPIWHQPLGQAAEATAPVSQPLSKEQIAAAVPISRQDFLAYAERHNLPELRASVTWLMTRWSSGTRDSWIPPDAYGAVIRLSPSNEHEHTSVLGLRSMYDRLRASRLDPHAWSRGSQLKVEFLATLVNEVLQPDDPLPPTRKEAIRLLPNTAELLTADMQAEWRIEQEAERRAEELSRRQAEGGRRNQPPRLIRYEG